MLLLRGLSGEGFATDWTGERSDTLMDSQMEIQVPLLAESLAAGGTDDLLLSFVPDQVLVEILLRSQTALAYLAFVSRFVVSIFHVRLDGGHILASVSADAADDGRLAAVHLIHVLLQVILDLELLLADRTRMLEAAGVFPYEVVLQCALVIALVLADTAGIQKRSVDVHDVALQLSFQTKALAAGLALIFVQTHVFYHDSFLTETFAARGALQGKLRFLLVVFVPTEVLFSNVFSRFSFSDNVSFDSI